VIDAIQSLPPLAAYAMIAGLVFGEAAIFIGFLLPGETAVVLGGFLASTHELNIEALCVLVVLSAVLGDSVGYEVGKRFGPRIMTTKTFRRHQSRLDAAARTLRERGGPAVFAGRFTAFFRAVMPGLAGVSRMRYPKFLLWNALGGLLWGVGFSLLGFFAGASYQKVAKDVGRGTAVVIVAIVILLLIGFHIRRKRRERRAEASPEGPRAPRRQPP
jgi:membrane-associated protein